MTSTFIQIVCFILLGLYKTKPLSQLIDKLPVPFWINIYPNNTIDDGNK